MKINNLCVLMAIIGLTNACSKLDETTKISKDMRDRSARMEESTNQLRQDSKAQATLEDMRASLDQIREAKTIQAMTAEAGIFFGYMPYQKIKLNAADREKFVSRSVSMFFLSPYSEYLPESDTLDPSKISVNPKCDPRLEPVCDNEKREKFTAFALASDIVSEEQQDYEGSNAQSFIDILINIAQTGKKINDKEIDITTLSKPVIKNLTFEQEAIQFLQYVHNAMALSAVSKIINLNKLAKEMSTLALPEGVDPASEEGQKMLKGLQAQKVMASIIMPKTASVLKATSDVQTANKIITALIKINEAPRFSPQVTKVYQLIPLLKSATGNKKLAEMSVGEKNLATLVGILERLAGQMK